MAFPVGGAVFLNISHALSEETLDFLCNVNDPLRVFRNLTTSWAGAGYKNWLSAMPFPNRIS